MGTPWPSLTLLPPRGSKDPGVVSARRRAGGWRVRAHVSEVLGKCKPGSRATLIRLNVKHF